MARGDLPVTDITRDGIAPAAEVNADTVNNHDFANDGRTFLLVRNSDAGGPHNVTIVTPGAVDSQAVADRVVAVPASSSRYIGPFSTNDYNVSGRVQVNVDHATLRLSTYRCAPA